MMRPRLKGQRLTALFLSGALLFNYPLLDLVAGPIFLAGIPLLYAYAFAAWGLLIALAALIVEKERD
jgi:hypothetical protein